jgi:hypothetical protein
LKGKRVSYVCEKNLEEHCRIATAGDLSDAVKGLDITDSKTVKVRINVDKRDKYLEDEATTNDEPRPSFRSKHPPLYNCQLV